MGQGPHQCLGLLGLRQPPRHDLLDGSRGIADVQPGVRKYHLIGRGVRHDPSAFDQGNSDLPEAGTEDASAARAGKEERLAQTGEAGEGGVLFHEQHPRTAHRQDHRHDEPGQGTAEDDRVPAPDARGVGRVEDGQTAH